MRAMIGGDIDAAVITFEEGTIRPEGQGMFVRMRMIGRRMAAAEIGDRPGGTSVIGFPGIDASYEDLRSIMGGNSNREIIPTLSAGAAAVGIPAQQVERITAD